MNPACSLLDRPTRRRGFTLMEVVMAVSIFAVAVVSIIGLLGAATKSDGESADQTVLVSITQQIMGDLRSYPFDLLWQKDPRAGLASYLSTLPNPTKIDRDTLPQDSIYFFTHEGTPITQDDPDFRRAAQYQCVVHKVPDRTKSDGGPARTLTEERFTGYDNRSYMLVLELRYSWPLAAPEANRKTQTVYEYVARY